MEQTFANDRFTLGHLTEQYTYIFKYEQVPNYLLSFLKVHSYNIKFHSSINNKCSNLIFKFTFSVRHARVSYNCNRRNYDYGVIVTENFRLL